MTAISGLQSYYMIIVQVSLVQYSFIVINYKFCL